jgi:hypothetical protein
MTIRNLHNRIAGVLLGVSLLLLVVGFGSSARVHAQDRNSDRNSRDRKWDQYGNYGGSNQLRQTALNTGYNEGVRAGNNDRQNSRHSDYRDFDVYQAATKDYNSRLGDRELYRRYFREAFENGYNSNGDGWGNFGRNDRDRYPDRNNDNNNQNRRGRNRDGYGNYGGSFQLRQTALNAGFDEGTKQGRKDRNKRNDSGFQDQNTYRKATKDYSSRLGDRETYRRYFREAYEHGYADGISGY